MVRIEAVYGPAWEEGVPDPLASLQKHRERLGYDVSMSLDEGPRRTIERNGAAEGAT